jgi:hypothetical protein
MAVILLPADRLCQGLCRGFSFPQAAVPSTAVNITVGLVSFFTRCSKVATPAPGNIEYVEELYQEFLGFGIFVGGIGPLFAKGEGAFFISFIEMGIRFQLFRIKLGTCIYKLKVNPYVLINCGIIKFPRLIPGKFKP